VGGEKIFCNHRFLKNSRRRSARIDATAPGLAEDWGSETEEEQKPAGTNRHLDGLGENNKNIY